MDWWDFRIGDFFDALDVETLMRMKWLSLRWLIVNTLGLYAMTSAALFAVKSYF